MARTMFARILELQERHLRLVERLHTREIDAERFRTELTRLRREIERLREYMESGEKSTEEAPRTAATS